jgi:hypothetical protein
MAGVTLTLLRAYVTGNNDIALNEAGRTMAVSLMVGCVGTPRGPTRETAASVSGPTVTGQDWWLSSHKGQ